MKRWAAWAAAFLMAFPSVGVSAEETEAAAEEAVNAAATSAEERAYIEESLNLANNEEQTWTYSAQTDSWTLSVVQAVVYPELPEQQGVSVCVPGAYVAGIDTDGDGSADVTAEEVSASDVESAAAEDGPDTSADAPDGGIDADTDAPEDGSDTDGPDNEAAANTDVPDGESDTAAGVRGALVIDYEAQIVSTNGQTYTAATAPVILNTGAAGYGSQSNQTAAATYAQEGYINVACGNRGKQDTATDENGNTYYTGDAPSCLADQKAAARYVKYNILLGNLPGSVDYFVSTGGSGGGAHATMFAATSGNEDFYDYQIEAGAVGVYRNEDGTYSTTVTIDGTDYELSDGTWGCIAYSAITPLAEADMALAFEYYMDTTYEFNTDFQKQLAEYLSEEYMEYINAQGLSVSEAKVGFDLNGDGDMEDTIDLTISYDPEAYPETNGYYGTYLDLYLAEFTENLQWYLDNLDYAEGWTWFDEDGNALSDEDVAAMTTEEKEEAFLEGRYAKGSTGGMDGMDGMQGGRGGFAGGMGGGPNGMDGGRDGIAVGMKGNREDARDIELPDGTENGATAPDMELPEDMEAPNGAETGTAAPNMELPEDMEAPNGAENGGADMAVGTPDAGTTQSASSSRDSANYESYEDMVASYEADIAAVQAGDRYGNNQVDLYNPLNYIGAEGTENPAWFRIVMGASEGDLSMFNSLNLQLALLNADVDAEIEWQWDGGHVPSEVLGNSFALYVDQMYSKHAAEQTTSTADTVDGQEQAADTAAITKPEAAAQTENGGAESATGTDISDMVDYTDISNVKLTLADAVAYRTKGASKAMPGFDVIDYGQEDYVFGDSENDARHWNNVLLDIFKEHADTLAPLFNAE